VLVGSFFISCDIMNPLVKFLSKTATSVAGSLISSEIKKHARGFIKDKFAKTPAQIKIEAMTKLGYETEQYTLDKNQNVIFKASPILFHEWLGNSPYSSGKIMKDEENGQIYWNGAIISPTARVNLINAFSKSTNVKSPALPGHLERAFDLFEVSDVTASKFKKEFSGWTADRTSVIDTFLQNAYGVGLETDPQYASKIFRKWIVGTARRAMEPGSTLDGCLVLQGPAGAGKTLFFRDLLPEPFNNRTGEIYCDIKSKEKFTESIVGKTIACFDELSVLEYPKTTETFKQMLSSQNIDVRLAWARKPRRYALRQGFCATVNKKNFIPDSFLSRRLWTISLNGSKRLDFDFLYAQRRSLWMEAVFLASKGESCILSPEEQKEVEKINLGYTANESR